MGRQETLDFVVEEPLTSDALLGNENSCGFAAAVADRDRAPLDQGRQIQECAQCAGKILTRDLNPAATIKSTVALNPAVCKLPRQ